MKIRKYKYYSHPKWGIVGWEHGLRQHQRLRITVKGGGRTGEGCATTPTSKGTAVQGARHMRGVGTQTNRQRLEGGSMSHRGLTRYLLF